MILLFMSPGNKLKKSKLLLMNSVSYFFWENRPVVEWQNARVRCLRQWVCHQSDSRFSRILKIFFLHFHFSFSISSHFFHFSKKSESIFFTLHLSKKSASFYFSLFTSRTFQTHSRRGLQWVELPWLPWSVTFCTLSTLETCILNHMEKFSPEKDKHNPPIKVNP